MTQTDYFKYCKSLDEAKKLYYSLAKLKHPDLGGDHQSFQDLSNQFHAFKPRNLKYNEELNDWSSMAYAGIIESLMKIPDITIEICGSWIWLTGRTMENRDLIKSVPTDEFYKSGFSANKKAWYFSPKQYVKRSSDDFDLDSIRSIYGSDKITSPSQKQIKEGG